MASDDKYVPFSIRSGRRRIPQLGFQDMPRELRVSLWNVIEPWLFASQYGDEYQRRMRWIFNFHAIRWETAGAIDTHLGRTLLNKWFMTDASADDIYDFIEAVPQMVFYGVHAEDGDLEELRSRSWELSEYVERTIRTYQGEANAMLEREGSPYRIVENLVVPITNEVEIDEVSTAVSARDRFAPARDHISEALKHLGSRPPAYADCIKQAASAVESALKIGVGTDSGRMGALLKTFEDEHGALHPAFRTTIEKLYGYASDESGVRHGATAPVSVGAPEARAMLVMCSALMNFLIRKASA